MKKPDTTRNPLAVITWTALELARRGVKLDVYLDVISESLIVFDYSEDPPRTIQKPRACGNAIAEALLLRHAPDLTMPPQYTGNHRGKLVPKDEPPPAPAPAPLSQAQMRAQAQTPLERAAINGLGRAGGATR